MRIARGFFPVLALVFGITLGAPMALSGIDPPLSTEALNLLVDGAAAQEVGDGGVANLHDLVTIGAMSETPMSLNDSPTGDITNVVIYNIEDTDETVVINNAGNPGSTGNHMMNVGGDPQAINTGGNNNSATSTNLSDSVLCNGSFDGGGNASAGDATGPARGEFASTFVSADPFAGDSRICNNNSENPRG
jgi:hypothetical protein